MNQRTRLFQVKHLINRLRQRLWVKPLVICLLSITVVFAAKIADGTKLGQLVPVVTEESIETLLSVMAASMLVIATFALASMVSAYASASSAATPRSFTLVIADDVSQNALSTFIGSFIFSIVALTAVKNDYFEAAARFALFVLTVMVFGIVILTFVRWVDSIARLGRLRTTIDKVERATASALKRRRGAPTLHGVSPGPPQPRARVVSAPTVGYVQRIDVAALQAWAERVQGRVVVSALPGTFTAPGRVLAYVSTDLNEQAAPEGDEEVAQSFLIGNNRLFDDDPRFGLVVLSEIAGRALSPAVNDPGTAIGIVGTLVRLFVLWSQPTAAEDDAPHYGRVEVPEVSVRDMFDDAFTAIARDGADAVEVAVRLQKALQALASIGNAPIREASEHHARLALARAEAALDLAEDLAAVRDAARSSEA